MMHISFNLILPNKVGTKTVTWPMVVKRFMCIVLPHLYLTNLILGYILILFKKLDFCFAGFILFVFSLKKDYYKVQFSLVRKNTSNFYFVK